MENENPDTQKEVKNKISEAVITPDAPFADDALGREGSRAFFDAASRVLDNAVCVCARCQLGRRQNHIPENVASRFGRIRLSVCLLRRVDIRFLSRFFSVDGRRS